MKILCLVDRFYPDSSANTICADNIAYYFKAKGHSVDFLAVKINVNDETHSVYNGSNVIKIGTYYDRYLKKYGKKYNAEKWADFPWLFRKYQGLKNRVLRFFRPATQYVNLDCVNYREICGQIREVSESYDAIISICMPFAFQVIANKLIKMGIAKAWYPVFLDAFVYNKCLNPRKINYRKKLAKKILKPADKIFMVDGIVEENIKQGFLPYYHEKVDEIYIPMLKEINLPEVEGRDNDRVVLTYAGLFYRDIRRPDEMLSILSHLSSDCEVHIIGDGCEDVVREKSKLFKECELITFGRVSHERCMQELAKSDILINLGNTITNQMPSKVFEYISFGKPIINFYFTEEDMCLKVFKKYPLAFNINVNNYSQETINNLKKFIKEHTKTQLSFDEATSLLPEYRVENIVNKMYEVMSK